MGGKRVFTYRLPSSARREAGQGSGGEWGVCSIKDPHALGKSAQKLSRGGAPSLVRNPFYCPC